MRRIKDGFKEHKRESDPETIKSLVKHAEDNLEVIKRQVNHTAAPRTSPASQRCPLLLKTRGDFIVKYIYDAVVAVANACLGSNYATSSFENAAHLRRYSQLRDPQNFSLSLVFPLPLENQKSSVWGF